MTVGLYFDKTPAVRIRENRSNVDGTTGKFSTAAPTVPDLTLKIHVSKPKTDIMLPGGLVVERGDMIVHLDAVLDVKEDDILVFWERRFAVISENNRSDVLNAVVQYNRKSFLVRELNLNPP